MDMLQSLSNASFLRQRDRMCLDNHVILSLLFGKIFEGWILDVVFYEHDFVNIAIVVPLSSFHGFDVWFGLHDNDGMDLVFVACRMRAINLRYVQQ